MFSFTARICLIAGAIAIAAAPHAKGADRNIEFLHADAVHALGYKGQGVIVALLDAGVNVNEPSIRNHLVPGCTIVQGGILEGSDGSSPFPMEHGTIMAMLITAPCGVAPEARILLVRWLNSDGHGNYYGNGMDFVKAVQIVTAKKHQYYPTLHVISAQHGIVPFYYASDCGWCSDFYGERTAILAALASDIVTVAATGNEAHCSSIATPACSPYALPVVANYDIDYHVVVDYPWAACDDGYPQRYRLCCFSNIPDDVNFGCQFLVAAPGHAILCDQQGPWDGTSCAGAEVCGVLALMYSKAGACGGLSAFTARSLIRDTADPTSLAGAWCEVEPVSAIYAVNALAAVNAINFVPCSMPGDLDGDAKISPADFRWFADCMSGPSVAAAQGFCAGADFPLPALDGFVDLRDFAQFQLAFTGYGSGACCHPHGECSITTVKECADEFGATYQGHGTTCDGVQCDPGNWGACCHPDTLTCTESTREDCIWGAPGLGDEGMYLGDGTRCATAPCPALRYRNVIDPPDAVVQCHEGLQLADDITLEGSGAAGLAYYDLAVLGGGTGFFDVTVSLYTACPGYGGELIDGTERTFADNPNYGSPVFLTATFDTPVFIPKRFWMVVTFSDSSCGWFRAERAEVGSTGDYFARNDTPWVCDHWWGDELSAGLPADLGCERQC